jgi:hypothetical protein
VVQPLLTEADPLDIAKAIEDGKRIAMFEHAAVLIHPRRRGQDVKLVLNSNDLFHACLVVRVYCGR